MTTKTLPPIFINYRSSDEPLAAVLLDRELSARFGSDSVFLDSRSMDLGTAFDTALLSAVRGCAVLLVVIGARWLTATDEHGRRLIDQRNDWVRMEIAEAHAAGRHVVPVLVGDVADLPEAALPASTRWLARNHYARLRHRDSKGDLESLIARLGELEPGLRHSADTGTGTV